MTHLFLLAGLLLPLPAVAQSSEIAELQAKIAAIQSKAATTAVLDKLMNDETRILDERDQRDCATLYGTPCP